MTRAKSFAVFVTAMGAVAALGLSLAPAAAADSPTPPHEATAAVGVQTAFPVVPPVGQSVTVRGPGDKITTYTTLAVGCENELSIEPPLSDGSYVWTVVEAGLGSGCTSSYTAELRINKDAALGPIQQAFWSRSIAPGQWYATSVDVKCTNTKNTKWNVQAGWGSVNDQITSWVTYPCGT